MLKKISFGLLCILLNSGVFAFPLLIQEPIVPPQPSPMVTSGAIALDLNPEDTAGVNFALNKNYVISCTLTNRSNSVMQVAIDSYNFGDHYKNAQLALTSGNNVLQHLTLPTGSYTLTVNGFFIDFLGGSHGIDIYNYSSTASLYVSNCQAKLIP